MNKKTVISKGSGSDGTFRKGWIEIADVKKIQESPCYKDHCHIHKEMRWKH